MRLLFSLFACLLMFLSACSGPLDTGPGLPAISKQFSEAMRWQDYIGAGFSLHEDVRGAFLDQFQQEVDVRVVESRIVSIELDAATKTAEADYRLEFYRLPSMRVKEWQWNQQWQLQQQKSLKSAVWQIVNPPPPLP